MTAAVADPLRLERSHREFAEGLTRSTACGSTASLTSDLQGFVAEVAEWTSAQGV